MLFVGYGETGGYPIFGVSIGSLTTFHRYLLVGRSWRTAPHAYAHHNHKEEVFGEWVFTFQGTFPFSPHKENGMRVFASHPIARGNGLNIRCQKVFLTFFSDATYGNLLH